MAAQKKEIQFAQTTSGQHFIRNTIDDKTTNEVEIDVNKLNIADIRKLINGLANIMSSLSSAMYKFEK